MKCKHQEFQKISRSVYIVVNVHQYHLGEFEEDRT